MHHLPDNLGISSEELQELNTIISTCKTLPDFEAKLGAPDEVIQVNSNRTRNQFRFSQWQTVSLIILEDPQGEFTKLLIPESDNRYEMPPQ